MSGLGPNPSASHERAPCQLRLKKAAGLRHEWERTRERAARLASSALTTTCLSPSPLTPSNCDRCTSLCVCVCGSFLSCMFFYLMSASHSALPCVAVLEPRGRRVRGSESDEASTTSSHLPRSISEAWPRQVRMLRGDFCSAWLGAKEAAAGSAATRPSQSRAEKRTSPKCFRAVSSSSGCAAAFRLRRLIATVPALQHLEGKVTDHRSDVCGFAILSM